MVGGKKDILRGPKNILKGGIFCVTGNILLFQESPDCIEQLLDPPRAQDHSLLHDVRPEFAQVNVAVSVWIHPLMI